MKPKYCHLLDVPECRFCHLVNYGLDCHNNPIQIDEDAHEPSKCQLVSDALPDYVPSAKQPHIDALAKSGLLDSLTAEQCAEVVKIAQAAYQNGRASTEAEKIDNDYVWINGIGGIQKVGGDTWRLTSIDDSIRNKVFSEMGSTVSEAKAAAARQNGKKGGRPRKRTE